MGEAWSGDSVEGEETASRISVALDDPTRLGITTLGQLKEHPRIVNLRAFMEGWYLVPIPEWRTEQRRVDLRARCVAGTRRISNAPSSGSGGAPGA